MLLGTEFREVFSLSHGAGYRVRGGGILYPGGIAACSYSRLAEFVPTNPIQPPLLSATPAGQGPPMRDGLFHPAGRARGAGTVFQTGAGKQLIGCLFWFDAQTRRHLKPPVMWTLLEFELRDIYIYILFVLTVDGQPLRTSTVVILILMSVKRSMYAARLNATCDEIRVEYFLFIVRFSVASTVTFPLSGGWHHSNRLCPSVGVLSLCDRINHWIFYSAVPHLCRDEHAKALTSFSRQTLCFVSPNNVDNFY